MRRAEGGERAGLVPCSRGASPRARSSTAHATVVGGGQPTPSGWSTKVASTLWRLGSRGSGTCAASTATRSTPSYRTPPRAAPGRLLCVVQRSAGSRRPRAWTGATPQRARTAPSPQWRLRWCLARPIEAGSSRSSRLTSSGDCLSPHRESQRLRGIQHLGEPRWHGTSEREPPLVHEQRARDHPKARLQEGASKPSHGPLAAASPPSGGAPRAAAAAARR